MKVYLDNAATTCLDKEVLEAMMPYFENKYGNPSSIHGFGREARAAIERARKTIAGYLNASSAEIFFTSGGTESANMILYGCVNYLQVTDIVTSRIEHHCVLHPVEDIQKQGKVRVHYVALDEKGNVCLDDLENKLRTINGKVLVALMHANNEIGNILDVEKTGEIAKNYGALFFTDTVQTLAHHRFDLQKLKIDFLTGSAHKFHGPKGIGIVYINQNVKLPPLIHGGSQERNMRSGTENIYGIVGMAKALQICYDNLEEHEIRISLLKKHFYEGLKAFLPEISVNGNYGENSLCTVLNVLFPENEKADYLLFNLDIEGIAVSAGSACSSGSNVGSHVLQALNVPKGSSSVRFSFSRYNTIEELNYTLDVIAKMLVKQ